jgi:hypothetical protein
MSFRPALGVQSRHGVSLGICALVLGISPHLCAAKPPPSVFGDYAGIGCPANGTPDGCLPTTATDRVRILRGKGGRDATVIIKIVFAEGHTCTLEGSADWSDGAFTLRADGLDPNKPCQLVLHISRSVLTLEDSGGLCRDVYCGTRGALDGARFKKTAGASKRRRR